MKASYILKKNRVRVDGMASVYIMLQHKGRKMEIATDIVVPVECWQNGSIVGKDKASLRKNLQLQQWWLTIQDVTFQLRNKEIAEVRDAIVDRLFPERGRNRTSFLSLFDAFMESKQGRTREIYLATRNKLERYGIGRLAPEEITPAWLTAFDASMDGVSRNARNIHLRNIRAVFNYAIDDELTTAYPFRKFKIRNEATRKRALTVEQLRDLLFRPVEKWQKEYQDFFLLTFLLIGINVVDLCRAKGLTNGRLEYRRAKTGRLYSVKVEPEAEEVATRLAGKDWWICPLDRYRSYKDYLQHANRAMQRVGEVVRKGRGGKKIVTSVYPEVTTYWMRHTWATIAASLDIPKETIAAALGHGGNSVTDIYIDFDQKKVDEANRKVIDYVFHGNDISLP